MSLLELVMTLVLLGSILVVLAMVGRVAAFALRGRWASVRGAGRTLGLLPGRLRGRAGRGGARAAAPNPGARSARVFRRLVRGGDQRGAGAGPRTRRALRRPATRLWVATVEVSSDAKRVRQRAPDARALLEDGRGREYAACGAPLAEHALADELDPGEAFRVAEPFRLPTGAVPEGVVISHGAFPGVLIIGDDQSLLHARTLLGLAVRGG